MLQVLCFETWPVNEAGHQVEEVDLGQTVAEQSVEACGKWPLTEPKGEQKKICDFVLNIIVMNTKFPAAVMVLQDVVNPWMDGVANGRYYVFQQDGALTHNPNVTQNWWQGNLPEFWTKEVWPPSSPDCNPLDYYM
jgi:predicted 2-oxoglutarate/Fe(II)-dependent dioxygenase YbiX